MKAFIFIARLALITQHLVPRQRYWVSVEGLGSPWRLSGDWGGRNGDIPVGDWRTPGGAPQNTWGGKKKKPISFFFFFYKETLKDVEYKRRVFFKHFSKGTFLWCVIAGTGFGPPLTYLYVFTEALILLTGGWVWVCCCSMLGFVFSNVVPALKGIRLICSSWEWLFPTHPF